MITAAHAVALIMLASLAIYTLTGGADFGGGVWDLFARGPRTDAQRKLIERSIAPIWEANHVWLILVVVLLFSAFPSAYAAATTALHIPLTLMLIGIVLRGSAFVFRHYSPPADPTERRWGRVFAVSSALTPIFLGVTLGAVTEGNLRIVDGVATGGFVASWAGLFPLFIGLLALFQFAFLAAVYLTNEADDRALQDDFRFRALVAATLAAVAAVAAALVAPPGAWHFAIEARRSPFWWPLHLALVAAALIAAFALVRRRYRLARLAAIAEGALVVGAWGFGQYPFLIAPDLTIADAAAPARTLHLLLYALGAGALILFPSLFWLFRIFKKR